MKFFQALQNKFWGFFVYTYGHPTIIHIIKRRCKKMINCSIVCSFFYTPMHEHRNWYALHNIAIIVQMYCLLIISQRPPPQRLRHISSIQMVWAIHLWTFVLWRIVFFAINMLVVLYLYAKQHFLAMFNKTMIHTSVVLLSNFMKLQF